MQAKSSKPFSAKVANNFPFMLLHFGLVQKILLPAGPG